MSSILTEAATSVIHRLSQEILNFSMYMLGCKVALEQDLSIGAIFRRKTYWDVPLILSTRLNGMYLSILVLYFFLFFIRNSKDFVCNIPILFGILGQIGMHRIKKNIVT